MRSRGLNGRPAGRPSCASRGFAAGAGPSPCRTRVTDSDPGGGFKGDQWETYHIFVSWEYDSGGRHYEGSDYLSTEGDAMNVWFSVVMD